jgi:hypothetical protein
MHEPEHQRILDEEHLRLLRIGYFIQGGATLVMCLFGLLYVFLGLFAFRSFPNTPGTSYPPVAMGYIFAWMGGLFTLAGVAFATLQFLTARALRLRRSRALCMVTAGLSCIFVPYGTALGVFTLIVLGRPSVRDSFNEGPVPPAAGVAHTAPPGPPTA